MAHKKGAGSTKNGRDSNAKRLGVKRFGGEKVKAGNILNNNIYSFLCFTIGIKFNNSIC